MIALCTGTPSAKAEGDHIIATIPSGEGVVQIALTPHQAIHLNRLIGRAAISQLEQARVTAEVVPFFREVRHG